MAEDDAPVQDPLLVVSDFRFALRLPGSDSATLRDKVTEVCQANDMYTLYEQIGVENGWEIDGAFVQAMRDAAATKLTEIDEKKKEAEEKEGDVEVRDIELERARVVALTEDYEAGSKALLAVDQLTIGKNIDRYLSVLRLCLAHENDSEFKKYQETTQGLIDKGGDWDRRNRFNVYVGVAELRVRNFKDAAEKFLDSIATFTASEIFDYRRLVLLTVVSSLFALERPDLKKKVVDSPDILQVIDDIPNLTEYVNSFYDCRYDDFFGCIVEVMNLVRQDSYLSVHANYYLREVRLRGYKQFLQSYLSVTIENMATSFGISASFLDEELSSFIAAGRLNCKIDKVGGIVTMNRRMTKNDNYHELMRKGDNVLNRIQRLSRVITM